MVIFAAMVSGIASVWNGHSEVTLLAGAIMMLAGETWKS